MSKEWGGGRISMQNIKILKETEWMLTRKEGGGEKERRGEG